MEQAKLDFFARGGTVTICPTRKAKGTKIVSTKHLGRTRTTCSKIPGWRMPKNR